MRWYKGSLQNATCSPPLLTLACTLANATPLVFSCTAFLAVWQFCFVIQVSGVSKSEACRITSYWLSSRNYLCFTGHEQCLCQFSYCPRCCIVAVRSFTNVILWIVLKIIYVPSNNLDSATILIAEGEYQETVNVARQGPLTLLVRNIPLSFVTSSSSWRFEQGQLASTASESLNRPFANASQVPFNQNLVKIWNNQHVQPGINDIQSAVLVVGASPHASFGNPDFKVYNIDFENRAVNLGYQY